MTAARTADFCEGSEKDEYLPKNGSNYGRQDPKQTAAAGKTARPKTKRRCTEMKKSNNSINVPEARQAMEQFKQTAASDLDVPTSY